MSTGRSRREEEVGVEMEIKDGEEASDLGTV
jgi:hypothetical protein